MLSNLEKLTYPYCKSRCLKGGSGVALDEHLFDGIVDRIGNIYHKLLHFIL